MFNARLRVDIDLFRIVGERLCEILSLFLGQTFDNAILVVRIRDIPHAPRMSRVVIWGRLGVRRRVSGRRSRLELSGGFCEHRIYNIVRQHYKSSVRDRDNSLYTYMNKRV